MTKVQCPIWPTEVCDKSIAKPVANPVRAPISGVLSAAQIRATMSKILNPPSGSLSCVTKPSCNKITKRKTGAEEKKFRNDITFTYAPGEGEGVTYTVTVGIGVGTGRGGTNASRGSVPAPDTTTDTTPSDPKFV